MNTEHHGLGKSCVAALVVAATLLMAGCTRIPELDKAVPDSVRKADFPELTALDESLAIETSPQDDSEEIAQEMLARRDRLIRKAERLQTPVLDAPSQTRLQNGITP